ncbi:neugrin-like [Lytechinus variegatus]|uniref:neugrin-like n=1 Tax=Lytechinus variegatus TaxID=7654 RepID=UPI001BB1422B|nr:neugrin-like [Lytechinus variegatus]
MLGNYWKNTSWKVLKTGWQSFQRNENAIGSVARFRPFRCRAVNDATSTRCSSGTAGSLGGVHIGSVAPSSGCLPGQTNFTNEDGKGIIARRFSGSMQVCRRDCGLEDEQEKIERHLNNPLDKYLERTGDEFSEKTLEEITREQKRKIASLKRARAAREFRQGPERRTLSWDTIQQIHYLRQENPEDWSVASLSQSFNVSEEAIAKVLKSKFRPDAKTRRKQDLAAAKTTGYVTGGTNLTQAPALVARDDAIKESGDINEGRENKHVQNPHAFGHNKELRNTHRKSAVFEHNQSQESAENHGVKNKKHWDAIPPHTLDKRQENDEIPINPEVEYSLGSIDFENVDSLIEQTEVKLKPQVFKKGRNFYNEHGEFLYRI